MADDPQRRLALVKPKLPNDRSPPGFLGFAVNMIHIDVPHLSSLTRNGYGLRETLFYSLFSRLQVYRSRAHMLQAVPCISDGAISLDGGMIRSNGVFVSVNRYCIRWTAQDKIKTLREAGVTVVESPTKIGVATLEESLYGTSIVPGYTPRPFCTHTDSTGRDIVNFSK
ncbi:unnamed protein product [Lactuca saligna]|uniref:Uncharacterized protein n=1 Tax=Lactuca saligna TaxID=75948 RepID=A0AA35YKR5_LACSI|nr:unnamed protein product [Lactuca saligna]